MESRCLSLIRVAKQSVTWLNMLPIEIYNPILLLPLLLLSILLFTLLSPLFHILGINPGLFSSSKQRLLIIRERVFLFCAGILYPVLDCSAG